MNTSDRSTLPRSIFQIVDTIDRGYSATLLTGRNLTDLDRDGTTMRPLLEILRRALREIHGMLLVTLSLAEGIRFDALDTRDRRLGEPFLNRFSLLDSPGDRRDPTTIFRGILEAARTPAKEKWPDGSPVKFAFLIRFVEHLAPQEMQTEEERVLAELATLAGPCLAVRSSGHVLLFDEGQEGRTDHLVREALHITRLEQPDVEEKKSFLQVALNTYADSRLEESLATHQAALIMQRTPNREIESQIRESHRTHRPLTRQVLVKTRTDAVARISEGSLRVLDSSENLPPLAGHNALKVDQIVMLIGEGLASQNPTTTLGVVLVGPPGTGKTHTMRAVASRNHVVAVELATPKRQFNGESERVLDLQWSIINESGGLVLSDEITEKIPAQRSQHNGDNGVSDAIAAKLLFELSNEAMRGKRCLVGTTNCPWRMGEAMRDRFEWIPALYPLPQDLPSIITTIILSLYPGVYLDETDSSIQRAAQVFQRKAANPREIRSLIAGAAFFSGEQVNPALILHAAEDFIPTGDSNSIHLADLWAVKACKRHSFLPWADDPVRYEYPPHIENVMSDVSTGEVDSKKLNDTIARLMPHANV